MLRSMQLKTLNPHITCVLCGGYLVDATTIIECLHSFCSSCIARYLETSFHCPVCDVEIHKTKPLLHIRPDRVLQDIVYKLVPDLCHEEHKERKELREQLKNKNIKEPKSEGQGTSSGNTNEEKAKQNDCPDIDDPVCISLEYYGRKRYYRSEEQVFPTRYLRCSSKLTVGVLKKFLSIKFGIPPTHQPELVRSDEILDNHITMRELSRIYGLYAKSFLDIQYIILSNEDDAELKSKDHEAKKVKIDHLERYRENEQQQQQTKRKRRRRKQKQINSNPQQPQRQRRRRLAKDVSSEIQVNSGLQQQQPTTLGHLDTTNSVGYLQHNSQQQQQPRWSQEMLPGTQQRQQQHSVQKTAVLPELQHISIRQQHPIQTNTVPLELQQHISLTRRQQHPAQTNTALQQDNLQQEHRGKRPPNNMHSEVRLLHCLVKNATLKKYQEHTEPLPCVTRLVDELENQNEQRQLRQSTPNADDKQPIEMQQNVNQNMNEHREQPNVPHEQQRKENEKKLMDFIRDKSNIHQLNKYNMSVNDAENETKESLDLFKISPPLRSRNLENTSPNCTETFSCPTLKTGIEPGSSMSSISFLSDAPSAKTQECEPRSYWGEGNWVS